MLFSSTYEAVISGHKTMTRRPIRRGEKWKMRGTHVCVLGPSGRLKWRETMRYKVQPGRGQKGTHRIVIESISAEPLHAIMPHEACNELGLAETEANMRTARERFKELWDELYGDDPFLRWEANPDVWVLTFELV